MRAASAHLLPDVAARSQDPAEESAQLLVPLARMMHETRRADHMWLVLTALSGAFPTSEEVVAALRFLDLETPDRSALWLLETSARLADRGAPYLEMDVVSDSVVVDVDYSACHELHTGIQRVVRETMPRWDAQHEIRLVAWTPGHGAMRSLAADESDRVLRWGTRRVSQPSAAGHSPKLVVPWRSTVVLAEVPDRAACEPLAALSEHSGNRVAAIGYDCIPIVSADYVPLAEPNKFVHYLRVIKHAAVVAGISSSASDEFHGFADMLPAQGLRGPRVVECQLPLEVPAEPTASAPESALPVVLAVGSHEPRKNHDALMHAAEVLWREGLAFQLRLIGGSGWDTREFDRRLRQLRRAGRSIVAERSVPDEALWAAYRSALFTVFTSLHEGYGLPVAESLACGTPVITTCYGSTAEIGKAGGAILVDPRDASMLIDAMRRLLTDGKSLGELAEAARRRPRRSWDDYTEELWDLFAVHTPGSSSDLRV